MRWLWRLPDWPRYRWNRSRLQPLEERFLHQSGRLVGSLAHLDEERREDLRVEWLTGEAVESSAIEGEILDRDSVRSSIRQHLGLAAEARRASPAERGVAAMMVDLFRSFDQPLSHRMLQDWHRVLMRGHPEIQAIGQYREHPEPMQVVSGHEGRRRVDYEAPPSCQVPAEMQAFLDRDASTLPALTRAGIAHLHFVHIHPFEDGNGRIARALAEKAVAQALGAPSAIALSRMIRERRRAYYDRLGEVARSLRITDWLVWFAETILDAQTWSERRIVRSIQQTRLFDRLRDGMNPRQAKALLSLFRAEPDGFRGGMSAGNYRRITGASASTATRDLADLVGKGALRRAGTLRHTRYWLNLPPLP